MKRNGILTLACLGLLAASPIVTGHAEESANPTARTKSFDQLLAHVEALHVEQVAWRKISWKTCLLDGIRESRKQHKPIILWIFIDRPIDDERC